MTKRSVLPIMLLFLSAAADAETVTRIRVTRDGVVGGRAFPSVRSAHPRDEGRGASLRSSSDSRLSMWSGTGLPDAQKDVRSLRGSCERDPETQLALARQFARSKEGLALNENGSREWAEQYNTTHGCDTISEYIQRFRALAAFAVRSDGLKMSRAEARTYAQDRVDRYSLKQAAELRLSFQAMHTFAYESEGLNMNSARAVRAGREWAERGCEGPARVTQLRVAFRREFGKAYSARGMKMTSAQARLHAVDRVQSLTRCGDLLY